MLRPHRPRAFAGSVRRHPFPNAVVRPRRREDPRGAGRRAPATSCRHPAAGHRVRGLQLRDGLDLRLQLPIERAAIASSRRRASVASTSSSGASSRSSTSSRPNVGAETAVAAPVLPLRCTTSSSRRRLLQPLAPPAQRPVDRFRRRSQPALRNRQGEADGACPSGAGERLGAVELLPHSMRDGGAKAGLGLGQRVREPCSQSAPGNSGLPSNVTRSSSPSGASGPTRRSCGPRRCPFFLCDPSIDATNWRPEDAIRPAVITRKVCGGNPTRKAADTQQVLASVTRTASTPACCSRRCCAPAHPSCPKRLRCRHPMIFREPANPTISPQAHLAAAVTFRSTGPLSLTFHGRKPLRDALIQYVRCSRLTVIRARVRAPQQYPPTRLSRTPS